MSSNLIQQLQSVRSMSIVGMCKNAGKTTMLNWLLAHSGRGRVLGLTSIGRDGESTDFPALRKETDWPHAGALC